MNSPVVPVCAYPIFVLVSATLDDQRPGPSSGRARVDPASVDVPGWVNVPGLRQCARAVAPERPSCSFISAAPDTETMDGSSSTLRVSTVPAFTIML